MLAYIVTTCRAYSFPPVHSNMYTYIIIYTCNIHADRVAWGYYLIKDHVPRIPLECWNCGSFSLELQEQLRNLTCKLSCALTMVSFTYLSHCRDYSAMHVLGRLRTGFYIN